MGDLIGFKKYDRKSFKLRPKDVRILDNRDVHKPLPKEDMTLQAARCMDCGTTFCSWGCPLGNTISYWNEHVQNGEWEEAYKVLSTTSNFPEFTSRICPALCESSCTLGINREAVSIKELEYTIIEKAFEEGWVKAKLPKMRTKKSVAIIGSGPAGLAVADELNSVGHDVVVYEKNDEVGGLLRYGIPNFKLEKDIIDRRVKLMKAAGIEFETGVEVGSDISVSEIKEEFDCLVLTGGSTVPRDLEIEGRRLSGIHFAVDYLTQHTMRVHDKSIDPEEIIDAKDKIVVVIGGGDTGSDCIGTAIRQGAKAVHQLEILPKPKETRDESMPWPTFPRILKTTSSHKEGCIRKWSVGTEVFKGKNKVESLIGNKVSWTKTEDGRFVMEIVKDSKFEIKADLVLLAMGFLYPQAKGVIEDLKLTLDERGNIKTDSDYMTSEKGVFSAGDMRQGQSLVVKAISEGRKVARSIDIYLEGESFLMGRYRG